jgi:hypothetical protein
MKQIFTIITEDDKRRALRFIQSWSCALYLTCTDESPRSLAQNRLLWSVLTDISNQIVMPMFDGSQLKASPEEWKDYLSAVFFKEQKIALGENGEAILIGRSTSKMKKKEFSELIEFIYAFGSVRNVVWIDPIPDEYADYARFRK